MNTSKNDKVLTCISIVMPVHNTPVEYLSACLDSIIAQTFLDWELIIVDDGSDNRDTCKCLLDYSSEDNRILIVRQEPSGAARARNRGFQYANGYYVVFLDSDDTFSEFFLEKMYQKIEEEQADLCICGWRRVQTCGHNIINMGEDIPPYTCNFDSPTERLSLLIAPITRIYRKSFLQRENIIFQSLNSSNDVAHCILSEILARKISTVPEVLVYYRVGTSFQISSNRDPNCVCEAYEYILDEIEKRVGLDDYVSELQRAYIQAFVFEIKKQGNDYLCEKAYNRIKMYFHEIKPKYDQYVLNFYLFMFQRYGYHDGWIKKEMSFEAQLLYISKNLLEEIGSNENINLWGLGKRGMAFVEWAGKKGIDIFLKYDRNVVSTFGNDISMLKTQGVIIASNSSIYAEISDKTNNKVINLEKYCPL